MRLLALCSIIFHAGFLSDHILQFGAWFMEWLLFTLLLSHFCFSRLVFFLFFFLLLVLFLWIFCVSLYTCIYVCSVCWKFICSAYMFCYFVPLTNSSFSTAASFFLSSKRLILFSRKLFFWTLCYELFWSLDSCDS